MFAGFKNLTVSRKVIGSFTLVLLATIALGLFSVQRLGEVNAKAADIRDNWLPATRMLGELKYITMRYRQRQAVYLMWSTDAQRAKERGILDSIKADYDRVYAEYQPIIDTDRERELAADLTVRWQNYLAIEKDMFDDARLKGQAVALDEYNVPDKKAFDQVYAALDAEVKFNTDSGTAVASEGEATFKNARLLIYVVLGLAVGLGLGCGAVLIRSVSSPISRITGAMGELAAGNLDAHVPHADQRDEVGQLADAMASFKEQLAAAERSKAEQTRLIVSSIGEGLDLLARGDVTHRVTAALTGPFAKLREDFNNAMERLEHTLQNVRSGSGQIATGAGELSQAADDLSRRTEQQAASLEETAAALEEITSTVRKTAQNARDASASASEAKKAAEEGGEVVQAAVTAMDAIANSSKQITDIIGVIDEIAFQTNLLALNAGVEAARAGEAGKGFAVVASEVRALAQRSSEAAKQIKALIHTSGDHVGTGVKLVGESGQALRHIIDQVHHINELVGEMTHATEQQSVGLAQVNTAVGQMDQVTQQNAAMVEESTAASRNLAAETQRLNELIAFFTVGKTEHAEPASSRQAVRPGRQVRAFKQPPHAVARHGARSTGAALQVAATEEWAEF